MLPPPSTSAAPMATAIAMSAHTADSRPDEMPSSTVVAGPVRAARAMACTGLRLGRRVVLGDPRGDEAEHDAGDDGAEEAGARVAQPAAGGVADVDEGDDRGADDGDDLRGVDAAVDGLEGVGLTRPTAHDEDADHRGEQADRHDGQGEDEALGRLVAAVEADGPEGRDAEDDRRHQGHGEALEEVGGHAGAVADVVAHVVGDGGRVAGVVLGDAGLDLADEVGAHVGRLGEDAAADAQEQREQRSAEAEADQDRRRRVLEDHDDDGGAQQAEAGGQQAGDAAGAEGDLQRRAGSCSPWPRPRCGRCRARPATCRRTRSCPEKMQPTTKAIMRNTPDCAYVNATLPGLGVDLGRGEEHHDRPAAPRSSRSCGTAA